MSTTRLIVADAGPAVHPRPRQRSRFASERPPLFAVYGTYAHGPQLFEAPIARPLRAGDITELAGRFVRMIPNHNGQRLQAVDVHEEVCAAFERRAVRK